MTSEGCNICTMSSDSARMTSEGCSIYTASSNSARMTSECCIICTVSSNSKNDIRRLQYLYGEFRLSRNDVGVQEVEDNEKGRAVNSSTLQESERVKERRSERVEGE